VAVPFPPPTGARAHWPSAAAPSLPPCASPHQKSTPLAVFSLYLLLSRDPLCFGSLVDRYIHAHSLPSTEATCRGKHALQCTDASTPEVEEHGLEA
jgi:hypothetical protein